MELVTLTQGQVNDPEDCYFFPINAHLHLQMSCRLLSRLVGSVVLWNGVKRLWSAGSVNGVMVLHTSPPSRSDLREVSQSESLGAYLVN